MTDFDPQPQLTQSELRAFRQLLENIAAASKVRRFLFHIILSAGAVALALGNLGALFTRYHDGK